MRHALILCTWCIGLGFVSSARAEARADAPTRQEFTAPGRPIPVSMAQFQALDTLAAQPQHAHAANATAAYSPERARAMTEAGVLASQFVIPTSVLILLIAAAPL